MDNENHEIKLHERSKDRPAVDLDAFPKDRENPFEEPFCRSDVVLIVEGKKLHAHKNILSVYSPVFDKMFHGDFAEKGAEEIVIKEQNHQAMVTFLKQMYPVHSYNPLADDKALTAVLPLADFYQSDHILMKCEDYIAQQAQKTENLPADRGMLYLSLCDLYPVQKPFYTILKHAAKLSIADIQSYYFGSLKPATQLKLLTERCKVAEDLLKQEHSKSKFLLSSTFYSIPTVYFTKPCEGCHRKSGHCYKCVIEAAPK